MSVKNVKEFLCSVKCVMLTNTDQSSSRNFISNNYNCKHRFINKLIKKKTKASSSCFLHLHLITARLCLFFPHDFVHFLFRCLHSIKPLQTQWENSSLFGGRHPRFSNKLELPATISVQYTETKKRQRHQSCRAKTQTTSSNEKAVIICIFSEAHSARMEEGHGRKASQTE